MQIGCDLAGARFAVDAAERWDSVIAGVAIHPNDAARMRPDELPLALAEIEQLARHPRVRAVGETGLDHYRTRDEDGHRTQRDAFAWHIGLAHATGKTLVIHDRDAHADVLDVLDAEGVPERVVMHCFSGDADFARACLDRGAWLSYAGPVTFKPNEHLREALRDHPAGQDPDRDRCALPDPGAVPGTLERLVPDPAHRPVPGRDAGPGSRRGLPGAGGERVRRVRRPLGRLTVELAEVRRRRRMVRRYDPSVPVAADVLERVLEAGLRVPSAGFTQGVSLLVLEGADVERYWTLTTDPTAEPDRWLAGMRTAPVLVLVWTAPGAYLDRYAEPDKGWTDRDPARWTAPYWHVDAGMAVLAMLYAAVDEGLGACFFGVPPDRIGAVADGVRGSRRSGARRRGQSGGSVPGPAEGHGENVGRRTNWSIEVTGDPRHTPFRDDFGTCRSDRYDSVTGGRDIAPADH